MNKKIYKYLLLIVSMFMFNTYVNAEEYIDIFKSVSFVDEVSNTFTYEIKQNDNNPQLLSDLPSTFTIAFDQNTTVDNKIATSSYILDFSNISFTKVGTYEFEISEISSSNEFIYPKDNNKYRVIVDVTRQVDSNNTPTDNLVINVNQMALLNDTDTKTEVNFETVALTYITLSKSVTGDLADRNEYFKFKVEIDTDKNLIIEGQDSVIEYKGQSITTSNVYDINTDNYVYLKHGQTITIGYNSEKQIPELVSGTFFTFREQDATNYKTNINNRSTPSKEISIMSINNPENNKVNYVNNYESIAFTGVILRILPFILLLIISVVGIIVLHKNESHN